MIKDEIIQTVRDKTDLVALVSESVRLVKRGPTWKGCCPFHKEKTPSFHVNPVKNYAYCYGCHKGADAIGFVQETEGLSFVEAVTMLAGRLGIEVEETRSPEARREAAAAKDQRESIYRANEIAAIWFEQNLWAGDVPAGIPSEFHFGNNLPPTPIGVGNAWAELAKRGLAPVAGDEKLIGATLRAFRIGYAPPFWDGLVKHLVRFGIPIQAAEQAGIVAPRQQGPGHYDRFRNRLMFAVIDVQGRVVGFSGRALPVPVGGDPAACKEAAKYVNTPESRVYTKGQHLFGLYQGRSAVRRSDESVLVEGNFDVVSLHARGIENVVAPLGTAFTNEQAALLKRFCTKVVLAFDGDAAGKKATSASREACTHAALSARVASLPAGKDPDVVVRERGAEAFRKMLSQSQGLIEWLIDDALDQASFHAAPLQVQLERVRTVGDILAKENDPDLRRLVTMHANRAAAKLGLTSSSSITVAQLQTVLATKLRGGDKIAAKPTKQAAPRSPEWGMQEAILGALIDVPELLADHESYDVEAVVDSDFALAVASLCRHGATVEALDDVPESLREFVSRRFVDPQLGLEDGAEVLRGNVTKLKTLGRTSTREDLLAELQKAEAGGDDVKVMAILERLDELRR